jgi:serine protease
MDDRTSRKRNQLVWVLLLLMVLVVWWVFRPPGQGTWGQGTWGQGTWGQGTWGQGTWGQATPDRDGSVAAPGEAAETLAFADPDDILVDLRDTVSPAEVQALARAAGIELRLVSDQAADERLYRARVAPDRRDALLAWLQRRPEVEVAEPDAEVSLFPVELFPLDLSPGDRAVAQPAPQRGGPGFPDDPKYVYQWHLRQIDMPEAWKLADGEGVVVAVLDTGVAYEQFERFHQVEDLAGVEFVKPYDFVGNDEHANDDHGHGTHVAGTIAQATNNGIGVAGVAPRVRIMPLKVLSGNGSGSVAGIADAIRYAADSGAQVINMSLGGRFPSQVLRRAVQYAHDKGVVVVCAAGNDGRGKVGYPAAYPGAIAVAATQFDEATTFYSNWGPQIDIAAPGGNTRLDQNGDGMPDGVLQNTIAIGDPTRSDYFTFMGTSMASPHAAGVAALVVGEGITRPAAVEAVLKESARRPRDQAYDSKHYGAGIIDARAAVTAARGSAGGWQLALAALLWASLVLASRGGLRTSPGAVAAAVLGSSGLFFLPSVWPSVSSWPVVEALTRGLPSWSLGVLGPAEYANPLTFSALLPLGLIVLLWSVARLRPVLAGLAVGVAAHLLFHAAAGLVDLRWVPDRAALEALWLGGNALACIGLARLVSGR